MRRYKKNRKYGSASPNTKSVKMSADDLSAMIEEAVTKALDGREEGKDDEGEEEVPGSAAEIIEAALEAVNEKRKSDDRGEMSDDEIAELLDAVDAAEAGKSDDEDTLDVGSLLDEAVKALNAKRKSRKTDELDPTDVEELMETVAEIMSDDGAEEEEEKGRKSRTYSYEKKSGRENVKERKAVQRKYSNIYMPQGEKVKTKNEKQLTPSIMLARAIKCLDVWGRQDIERAAHFARKNYQDADMEREFKALTATGPANGGYLIPEVYMDQIIELLYPKTVIFELGAQKVPLDTGNLTIPKMKSGTRATWGGEQRKIKTTEPSFGNVKLSAKRLAAIIPQSRELLMSTSYSADAIFANDLTRRMQLGLDFGGLYGTGGEFMPLGVYHSKEVEHIDANKLNNADLIVDGKMSADMPMYIQAVARQKNIDDSSLGWAFNSLMEGYLMRLKTTTGAYIYKDEMQTGKLLGAPYKISNQIPAYNGKTTDLFFGNWSDLLIGDQMGMETYTTLEGSWTDDEGVQHSAFDENLVATRATMYDDIAVRHAESFIVVNNLKFA